MTELSKYYDKMKEVGVRLQHQFLIDIDRLGPDFKFFATASSLPGRNLEETEIPFHGVQFRIPTVISFDGSIDITIRSDIANEIRTLIEIWANDHANLAMGGGGKKRIPSATAKFDLLDETLGNDYLPSDKKLTKLECSKIADGKEIPVNSQMKCSVKSPIRTYILTGVYPQKYSELTLDTASPDVSEFTLTLSYQYWYEEGKNPLK